MEVINIKNVITAIGNPILNNRLREFENINVINNDIQYQEGIFEVLEIIKDVDVLILSCSLPGNFKIMELVENIFDIRENIEIIFVLDKDEEKIEEQLKEKGNYKIINNSDIEVDLINNLINDKNSMLTKEKQKVECIVKLKEYKENRKKLKQIKKQKEIKEKLLKNEIKKDYKQGELKNFINEYKNKFGFCRSIRNYFNKTNDVNGMVNNIVNEDNKKNKIISVLGNNGAGKSVFSVMFAYCLKKYVDKILIIDFDVLNNSLHTILGVKKYSDKIKNKISECSYQVQDLVINIDKKIDLVSGINLVFNLKEEKSSKSIMDIINKISQEYDAVIIDTTSECFFEYTKEIINASDKSIFLTEPNLLELSKSKRILEIYKNNWKIDNKKINIVFNKQSKNSIKMPVLKALYSDYNIAGIMKLKEEYSSYINNNFIKFNLKKDLQEKFENIIKKMINNKCKKRVV